MNKKVLTMMIAIFVIFSFVTVSSASAATPILIGWVGYGVYALAILIYEGLKKDTSTTKPADMRETGEPSSLSANVSHQSKVVLD